MKEWEIQLLNEGFEKLNKTVDGLRKKKAFIETIETGDLIFIKNDRDAGNGLSYLGYVEQIAGLCPNIHNYAIIAANFQHGRCKILTIENGEVASSSDAEPAYQGSIYDSSILHKDERVISTILKRYKTNLKEIGLE